MLVVFLRYNEFSDNILAGYPVKDYILDDLNEIGYGRIVEILDASQCRDAYNNYIDAEKCDVIFMEISASMPFVTTNMLSALLENAQKHGSASIGKAIAWRGDKLASGKQPKTVNIKLDMYESESFEINSSEAMAKSEILMQEILRNKAVKQGATIMPGVVLSYDSKISAGATIHPYSVINTGVKIGSGAEILPYTSITDSRISRGCTIGPNAHVLESEVGENAYVGHCVEVKRSKIGCRTKIKHMSYIGDAILGNEVNIGAGTVICNYNGKSKHQTKIEDRAFIGSNTSLIAPLIIREGSYITAGSVITDSVPNSSIACARSKQKVFKGRAGILLKRR